MDSSKDPIARAVVHEGMRSNLALNEIVQLIELSKGLTERSARSLVRYRAGLKEDGAPLGQLEAWTKRFAAKLGGGAQ